MTKQLLSIITLLIIVSPLFTPISPTRAAEDASSRLAKALKIYGTGNHQAAQKAFSAILAAADATPHEQRLALHWRGRSELLADNPTAAITTLTKFHGTYPDDPLSRATDFNLGVAYQATAQYNAAIAAYRRSLLENDPINSYIYERMGDSAVQNQAYPRAIAFYQQGIAATSQPSLIVGLRQKIADVAQLQNNPAAAIAQYEAILTLSQIDWFRAKILKLMGDLQLDLNQPDLAYASYREAVDTYPTAYNSYLALIELVEAGVPVDEFQRGLVDYHAEAYLVAVAAFERYLASPEPSQPDEAHWYMALSQKGLGSYAAAIDTLRQYINRYPDSARWAAAHLEIGRLLDWSGRDAEAITHYRQFAANNFGLSGAGEALWRAGQLEYWADSLDEAETHLRQMAETYPANEYADDALYWSGRAAFKRANYETAAETWGQLASSYPNSDLASFGSYWQAKSLLQMKRTTEAKAVLETIVNKPFDYYALRARDLLVGQPPHSVPILLPTESQLATEQAEAEAWLRQWLGLTETAEVSSLSQRLQEDAAFQRGRRLLELGLRDPALTEFETVKDSWWDAPLEMYQLSLYFQKQNMGRLSILGAARLAFLSPAATVESAPIFIQRLFYPIYFPELLFAEAEALDIDPAFALALMRQESLFEHSAESIAGARGLMQVMPTTGDYIAEQTGFTNFSRDDLWTPYISVKFGMWYISQQLSLFEDKHTQFAALAAYNAGPGRVLEWVEVSDDLDTFVEEIPFWESRLYIRKIYVNLAAYRRLYGVESPSDNR